MKKQRRLRSILSLFLGALLLIGMLPAGALASNADTRIHSVGVLGFDEPTPGGSPASGCGVPAGANYDVNGIVWHGRFDESGDFVEGNNYYAEIYLVAHAGYLFGEEGQGTAAFDSVTVNGSGALVNHDECWFYGDTFHLYTVPFVAGRSQIREVALTGFVKPEVDAAPDDGVTAAEDASYTVQSVSWTRIGGGSVDLFEEKGKYRAKIVLKPKNGYTFGEEEQGLSRFDSVTINGKTSIVDCDASYVGVSTLVLYTRVYNLSSTIEKDALLYQYDFVRSFADAGWIAGAEGEISEQRPPVEPLRRDPRKGDDDGQLQLQNDRTARLFAFLSDRGRRRRAGQYHQSDLRGQRRLPVGIRRSARGLCGKTRALLHLRHAARTERDRI